MRYLQAGAGPPLLFLHGLLGYSFSWRFNLQPLSDIRQVFAPDLLGTGFSDRPSNLDCSAEACARRMLIFMDNLGAQTFDLAGTSHGGGVATLMASMAPERIRKLILVAPVNPWSKHGRWITRLLATRMGRLSMKTVAPRATFMNNVFLRRIYGDNRRITPGTLEGYVAPLQVEGTWDYGLNIAACWPADLAKLENAYNQIKSETLLLWGGLDPAVYVSSAQELLKRIPHARLVIFPSVGHLPYEETPGEFNTALRDFLA